MKTGLFIGRFQPFHNAHLQDVLDALKEVDTLYIGIGSPNEEGTKENPFSLDDRKKMIEGALKDANIKNCHLFSVQDLHNDEIWVEHIEKTLKPDIIYSGNEWTLRCFEKKGYKTKKIDLIPGISATIVREMIKGKLGWEALLPRSVSYYIKEHKLLSLIEKTQ